MNFIIKHGCGFAFSFLLSFQILFAMEQQLEEQESCSGILELPAELIGHSAVYLSPGEVFQLSQVSSKLKNKIGDESVVWHHFKEVMRIDDYGVDNERQSTKEKVKKHLLRVMVNTEKDPKVIQDLVGKYRLCDDYRLSASYNYRMISLYLGESLQKSFELYAYFASLGVSHALRSYYSMVHYFRTFDTLSPDDKDKVKEFLENLLTNNILSDQVKYILCEAQATGSFVPQDLDAARKRLEELVGDGNTYAVQVMLENLSTEGIEGDVDSREAIFHLERNDNKANELNEACIQQEGILKEKALLRKVKAMGDQDAYSYGYEKNPQRARELLEASFPASHPKRIKMEMIGVKKGKFGFAKDLVAFRKINERLLSSKDFKTRKEAQQRRYFGFLLGKYGYTQDGDQAHQYLQELIYHGEGLGVDTHILKIGYDYELKKMNVEWNRWRPKSSANFALVREFVETLVGQDHLIGQIYKVLGLKFGFFGYESNEEEATAFIKAHYISY